MEPVIRDSEDEDDEELLVSEDHVVNKPSQRSSLSWAVAEVDEILANNPSQGLDGTNERADQSSLSTGDLQRQIADASRGLFDSTMKHVSITSSAANRARRHSVTAGPGSNAKINKRTKTGIVTYGSSKHSTNARASDHGQFDAFRDEDPSGTLQTNFVHHEPVVMFRDTGDTIVDNESSQQRMVEQSINHDHGRAHAGPSETRLIDSVRPDSSDSSHFPWPTSSAATQTPGGRPKRAVRDETNATQRSATGAESSAETHAVQTISNINKDPAYSNVSPRPQASVQDATNEGALAPQQLAPASLEVSEIGNDSLPDVVKMRQLPDSSPQVAVPRVRLVSVGDESAGTSSKVFKGRKRKTSTADLEPVNSDDRDMPPKDLYKPRPSRRRATGIIEQPQDFSIVPEKASRKRRKTTTSAAPPLEPDEDELAQGDTKTTPAKVMVQPKKQSGPAAKTVEPANPTEVSEALQKPQPPREQVRATLKALNFSLTATSFDADRAEKPSPTKEASPLSAKKVSAPAAFSMPPPPPTSSAISSSPTPTKKLSKAAAAASTMPPPTSSAGRKSRRSHTTIFEDHVEFSGSQQRSPSLRQQQASRKLAPLKEVTNVSSQPTRRRGRTIVQDDDDDDDDEDELVKEPVPTIAASKKRGRPAKVQAEKKSISLDAVLENSDVEPDDEEIIVRPPKKRGRAAKAPAKRAAKPVADDSGTEFDEHEGEIDEPPNKKPDRRAEKGKANDQASKQVATETAEGDRLEIPAASNTPVQPLSDDHAPTLPKNDGASKAAAAVPVKSVPATHSPIKPSSKVVHRVGLNRKQRVQPLLKMVRPPVSAPAKKR